MTAPSTTPPLDEREAVARREEITERLNRLAKAGWVGSVDEWVCWAVLAMVAAARFIGGELTTLRTENETLRDERDGCAEIAGEALGHAMALLAIHERWKNASVDESAARIITVICGEHREAAEAAEARALTAEAERDAAIVRAEEAEEEARDARYKADCAEEDECAALSRAEEAESKLTALTAKLAQAEGEIATMRSRIEQMRPVGPRPCDCTRCDCGNVGDAREVADWDQQSAIYAALTNPEPPHGD